MVDCCFFVALNALSESCHGHIVDVQCQFHEKLVTCGGATVVDGRRQREGIEKMIAAAVGGKRRVLSEEGARSHDGRVAVWRWAIVDPPLAEYHSVFVLGDDEI